MEAQDNQAYRPERLLGSKEVAERYRVSVRALPALCKNGKIPKPIKNPLGRETCWKESDIDKHIRGMETEQ